MYVTTLIVAHLDYDGCMRIFEMQARPGSPITIARVDEFDEPHCGPFHFLDGQYRDTFEKGFAECKAWKLSESDFNLADGVYQFRTSWEGIPTERNSLSCYALSLPEYAVPIEIRFEDPHSDREYFKSVVRDTRRNRFIAYLECRSSYGLFDFLLEARFRSDPENFRSARYKDEHLTKPGAHVHPYKGLVPADSWPLVQQFLSQNRAGTPNPEHKAFRTFAHVPTSITGTRPPRSESPEPLQLSFTGMPSQLEVSPSVTLISAENVQMIVGTLAEAATQNSTDPKGNLPKLPAKPKQDLSEMFDGAHLTEKQREVISLRLEYGINFSKIASRLGLSRKTVFEHYKAAERKLQDARRLPQKRKTD
jgi:DNA-binding CsgD family transcriptional regulator